MKSLIIQILRMRRRKTITVTKKIKRLIPVWRRQTRVRITDTVILGHLLQTTLGEQTAVNPSPLEADVQSHQTHPKIKRKEVPQVPLRDPKAGIPQDQVHALADVHEKILNQAQDQVLVLVDILEIVHILVQDQVHLQEDILGADHILREGLEKVRKNLINVFHLHHKHKRH
jgi:hypothetical protein